MNKFIFRLSLTLCSSLSLYSQSVFSADDGLSEEKKLKQYIVEDEKNEQTQTQQKSSQRIYNSLGIKSPLQPHDLITPCGHFALKEKKISNIISDYIEKIANGTFKVTKEWSPYFSDQDIKNVSNLFQEAEKVKSYTRQYLNGKYDDFYKVRENSDRVFFSEKYLSFIKILRPLFETMAFYGHSDEETNAIGMYYLGRCIQLLSSVEVQKEEKEKLLNQAMTWYGLSVVIGRVGGFQTSPYDKNGSRTQEKSKLKPIGFGFREGKSQDQIFYNKPLKWLESMEGERPNQFFKDIKNAVKRIDEWEDLKIQEILRPLKSEKKVEPFGKMLIEINCPEIFKDLAGEKVDFFLATKALSYATKIDVINMIYLLLEEIQNKISEKLVSIKEFQTALNFLGKPKNLETKIYNQKIKIDILLNSNISKEERNNFNLETKKLLKEIEYQNGPQKVSGDLLSNFYFDYIGFLLANKELSALERLKATRPFIEKAFYYQENKAFIPLGKDGLMRNSEMKTLDSKRSLSYLRASIRSTIIFFKTLSAIENLNMALGINRPQRTIKELTNSLDEGTLIIPSQEVFEEIEKEYEITSQKYEEYKKEKPEKNNQVKNVSLQGSSDIKNETPKDEELIQYKKDKKKKEIQEAGENLRKRIQKMRNLNEEKKLNLSRKIQSIKNIRFIDDLGRLRSQKDLSTIEKTFLGFIEDQDLSSNFMFVLNDIRYYGYELYGKGKPEMIKGTPYCTRRVGKATRVVYTIDKDGIEISGLFKDHDDYMKFLNRKNKSKTLD